MPETNSTTGKLGLGAGAIAAVLPIPLFGIKLPKLPAFEQGLLTVIFIAAGDVLPCRIQASSAWAPASPRLLLLCLVPCMLVGSVHINYLHAGHEK